MLKVLDEIIDSAEGLPIGNYLSQLLANIFLSDFDHWLKEVKRVKYYFRYADDGRIFSNSKEKLHQLRKDIEEYLREELHLTIKGNWQVFPVDARGVDFLGYVFFHTHIKLRKGTKQRIMRKLAKYNKSGMSCKEKHNALGSYTGWLKYCNSKNLVKTINRKGNGKIIK